jgi:hypothetical protein
MILFNFFGNNSISKIILKRYVYNIKNISFLIKIILWRKGARGYASPTP